MFCVLCLCPGVVDLIKLTELNSQSRSLSSTTHVTNGTRGGSELTWRAARQPTRPTFDPASTHDGLHPLDGIRPPARAWGLTSPAVESLPLALPPLHAHALPPSLIADLHGGRDQERRDPTGKQRPAPTRRRWRPDDSQPADGDDRSGSCPDDEVRFYPVYVLKDKLLSSFIL